MGEKTLAQDIEVADITELPSSAENVEEILETEQAQLTDPLVAFIEKHGDTLVSDHAGNMIALKDAIECCPPLSSLIRAMGEGALSLVAARPAEQKPELVQILEEEKIDSNEVVTETAVISNAAPFIRSKDETTDIIQPISKQSLEGAQPNIATRTEPETKKTAEDTPTITIKHTVRAQIIPPKPRTTTRVQKTKEPLKVVSKQPARPDTAVVAVVAPEKTERDVVDQPEQPNIKNSPREKPKKVLFEASPFAETEQPEAESHLSNAAPLHRFELDKEETSPKVSKSVLPNLLHETKEPEIGEETVPESIAQLPVKHVEKVHPLFAVENTITTLVTAFESLEPNLQPVLNVILGEISELYIRQENLVDTAIQPEIEKKVAELFIQLLELVDIEYTPEIIASFVELILGENTQITDERLAYIKFPWDTNIHEVFKKILQSVASMKKKLEHAYAIGKSAIDLYHLRHSGFATA